MLACSILFIAVYGTTNELAARRPGLGTWYYAWEFQIPFVPAAIIPYWSIDLLFVGSFFLCSTRAELDTLGRRLVLATLAAGIVFLTFPLTLAFPRPPVAGPMAPLFDLLRGFDRPHNLFPSLHIAFRTILVVVYAEHTRGALRALVHVWFSLVGLSTLLTWQHHVVDVAGGFVLGFLCLYAIREEAAPRGNRNVRVGAVYALGALLLAPWSPVLLWPALSMALVAAGYMGLGPAVFRKEHGRLRARWVLAPVLVGHWLSLRWYARACRPWDAVTPTLWIGRRLTDREAADAVRHGVTAVLDLTAELSEARPFRALPYRNIQVLDLTAPTQAQIREALEFIAAQPGIVYVHCKIGYSRSAAIVGAALRAGGRTTQEALALLRAARPSIVIRPEAMAAVEAYR
jgi:protein-tyrosine phosphatase/membrane-associated phospholipid phosphatase